MERHSVVVTILGARGSLPMSGEAYARYGGATTCVLFQAGERFVVLDAGTGLLHLPREAAAQRELPLLLTHAHVDHLLGLPLCPCVMRNGARVDIYAATRGGLNARAQVERLLAPPLWPVGPEALPAEIGFHELPEALRLGDVSVRSMEGEHPGGVSLLRLEADGASVVFASDCTVSDALLPKLTEFARDCDLLLCDGQYRDDEWALRAAFGHSTWGRAAQLARECGAKRLRIIHHDPYRTDDELDAAAEELRREGADFAFGKEGECLRL